MGVAAMLRHPFLLSDHSMTDIAHSAQDMISGMTPVLREGKFVFAMAPDGAALPDAISVFQEDEGTSMILPLDTATKAGYDCADTMRCITLNVYSSLTGCGLTAAVATALSDNGIACNMVAAFHHDHAFVPTDRAEEALSILMALQTAS